MVGIATAILLRLKLTPSSASDFTASKMKPLSNCAYNGTFPFTFNLPEVVKNAIDISDVDSDALATVKAGLLFRIFPLKNSGGKGQVRKDSSRYRAKATFEIFYQSCWYF